MTDNRVKLPEANRETAASNESCAPEAKFVRPSTRVMPGIA